MRVFVVNMRGEALMPTTQRKARILLKEKEAKIYKYDPFTIQLLYPTGETKQKVEIGIDTGSKHIGFAMTSNEKVLLKGEVELRQDVKSNLTTRVEQRKSRRQRKTRYRKARFQNRKRKEGWLPPSIESRMQNTFNFINKLQSLVPNSHLNIEVGKFNIQQIKALYATGEKLQRKDYQNGPTKGYQNVRYYVFARDEYKCQVCGSKEHLRLHHIVYRGPKHNGSDMPDNLITVCEKCHSHENHSKGGILYEWMQKKKKTKTYKEPAFMNILQSRIIKEFSNARIIYGYETEIKRIELGLEKEHYNDAIAITNINNIKENSDEILFIKQFRKKKRSLHEATIRKGRKEPNRTQKRNLKNTVTNGTHYLGDTVKVENKIGYICGFSGKQLYVKDFEDNYITKEGKKYKQIGEKGCQVIKHNNNWIYQAIRLFH